MTPALPDRPPLPTYNDVRGSFNKYRSIAYGTWKPGEAKRFSEKSKRRNLDNIAAVAASASQKSHSEATDLIQRRRDLASASSESLDCRTLVPTEDEMSEIENCKTEPILLTHQPQFHQHHHQTHQCAQTTPSLTKRRAPINNLNSSNSTMTVSFEPDCYSSQDYINYCITRNSHYSTSTLPLACQIGMNRSMDALNDRLIHSSTTGAAGADFTRSLRRQKPSTSSAKLIDPFNFAPPMHKRTRSFDGATHFAVISPSLKGGKLSTFGGHQKSTTAINSTSQKTGAFQATKNFIKKLYNNSTTLPKKLRTGKSSQKLDRIKAATSPFYEMRYPEPEEIPYLPYNIQYEVESDDAGNENDEEDVETEMDIGNEEFDSSVAPSCSSSTSTTATHEKSMNGGQNTHDEGIFSGSDEKSQTGSDFTAPSCISSSNRSTVTSAAPPPPQPEQFQSWNDLFGHLKKEITEMRARDAQILENLKTVESQLSYVKRMDRSKSEYSPLSRMLNAPTTIPAGSRDTLTTSATTGNNNNRPPLRSTFI